MAQRDVLSLLEAGNKAQLEKLKENEHKTGFDDCSLEYIHKRIKEEEEEFNQEMHFLSLGVPNYKNMRKELADIANFCHMGILTCDKLIKEGE